MSGTYAVPGTITSLAAAINSLNTLGVNGPVTIAVAAGYTETAVTGGFTLSAVPGASSLNTIVFQKSGTGANPIIFAYTGGTATPASAIQDGIWRFSGADFITVDGIDLSDPNTSNPSTMEFGFGFFKANTGDGCQNNTIRNCRITLNRINNAAGTAPAVDGSRGIDVVNATLLAHTTALTPTSSAGANSNNRFYSNTIENCNYGISLIGFAAATPFTLADVSNDIGGNSLATGNTIVNYGGGGTTSPAAAIRTLAQYSINVSYNLINNNNGAGVNHAADLRGIHLNTATSAHATISNNTVTVRSGATTNLLTGIENASGATAASNSIIINNNLITNCSYSTATSGAFNGILSSVSAAYLSISNNTLSNNSSNGTSGNYYGIVNSGAVTTVIDLNNNLVNLGTLNASTTSQVLRGIFNSGGASTSTLNINSNTFQSANYVGTGSGEAAVIYHSGTRAVANISNNNFNNISLRTTGIIYMIYNSNSTPNTNVNNNIITTGFSNAATGSSSSMYLYYNFGSPTSGTASFNGNNFSNVTMVGSGTFFGYYQATSTSQAEIFVNNILSNVTATNSIINGIFHNYGAAASAITGNTVSNLVGSSVNAIVIGNSVASTSLNVNLNTVHSATALGAAGQVVGIFHVLGAASNIFKNKVYNLHGAGTTNVIGGIYVNGGGTLNIFNNLIGDLRAPTTTGVAIYGLYLGNATTVNAHFNTVNLAATSSGANFGSTALFVSSTPNTTLRNNIFVNNSSSTGTGRTYAYFRSSTTLTSYNVNSNNNLFYAGTPSATNWIYFDGTNSAQTLGAYKALMATRDGLSITENPTFVSTLGSSANFLDINTTTPTQLESAGVTVAGVTDDFGGTTRNVTTPDIGAWEGTFTSVPSCAGTPAPTDANSTQAAVCPSVGFSLFSTTSYSTPGIAYQWLASTTSSSTGYSAITNATLASLSYTDLPASTWFQLAVTCTSSGQSYTSTPVQVLLGPPSPSAISNSSFICNASTANLSLSSPVAGVSYQWQTSSTSSVTGYSAITNATLATRTITGSVVGPNWYSAVLTCTNNTTYTNVTVPVSVVVGAVPTASALASSATICASSNLTLTGGTDVGTVFSWSGPSGYTANVQNPVLTNVASGNYSFVAALGTCSSVVSSVSVSTSGFLALNSPVVSPSIICTGSSIQLSTTDYAPAKVNQYSFSSANGTSLIPLSSGSVQLVGTSVDDTPSSVTSIGFTFNYNGVNYTQFSASPDGWVMLGGVAAANEYSNNIVSTSNLPKLYPYWDDMATGTTGFVRSQLFGAAPTRTRVIEWFVTIPRATTGAPNSSFQTLLYEATGVVEFRYGTLGTDPGGLSSCGLTGDATTFNSVTYSTTSASSVTANNSNTMQPVSGTSYVFSPPALSYSWSSPAGVSSSTSAIVTSTPASTSIYSVDLTYQGCVTTRTMVATVVSPPSITISAASFSICSGNSATLTANGATTYTWASGSGSTSVVSPTATATNYTVIGSNGVCSTSASANVFVPGNPVVNISGSSGICTGQTASLTASGASTYSWSTGATTSSITDAPTSNTTYTVRGTDALGCSTTTTQLVTVAASLSISILGPSSICTGQSATLTGNGGVTYSWSTGANTSTILISPTTNTTINITGFSGTCSNTAVYSVTVNPLPTVAVSGGTTVCVGRSTTLTASGSATTFSWNTGATTNTVVLSPTTNTSYVLTGFSAAGCSTGTTVAITSYSLPILSVASTATGVCLNSSATLSLSGAVSNTWNVSGSPTTATLIVTPTANTTYSVSGSNALGCVASTSITIVSFSLPAVNITPNTSSVCAFSVANFTATGANSYTWGVSGATTAATSFTPASATVYTVTGRNSNNCINTATASVFTYSLPVVTISPASATLCELSPLTFTASGASTYFWNGAIPGATYAIAPGFSNTYTVAGTNSNGCSQTQTVGVTVLPSPVLAISPSLATVCYNSTSIYTVSGAQTYTWANNTNASTVAITPTATTLYSVSATGANGCVGVGSVLILLYPSFSISVNPASATLCPNTATVFTASGASSYSWSNGPLTASTSVAPGISTVYTVTGFDNNQCALTETVSVVTRTVPVISISPASASICSGASTSFTASGVTTFTWSNNIFSASNFVSPTTSTTYSVTGKNPGSCVANATIGVTVYNNPVLTITASSGTICSSEVVTFTANGASTYTWINSNSTGNTYTATPATSQTYSVTGVDANGCIGSASTFISVIICTSIPEQNSLAQVKVYPNPTSGIVELEFPFEGTKQIVLANSVGAVLDNFNSNDSSARVDLSSYAKGIYYVSIKANGKTANYKLVVQ